MRVRKINHTALAKTLSLLQRCKTVTAKEVQLVTGVHYVTASAWLRALREQRAVHIAGWAPDSMGRDAIPLYALGEGEDVPRRRESRAEIMKRYRQRLKERQQ